MKRLLVNGALGFLFLLQAVSALFFLADALGDAAGMKISTGFIRHQTAELIVVGVLLVSLILTGREIRRMLRRQKRMNDQLRIASGAFAEIIEAQFDAWGLSASEREVAMMAIKGLSVAEMAKVRRTKEGTIKAQSAAVYRKAGVSGRLQLLSLFIEELIAAAPGGAAPAAPRSEG